MADTYELHYWPIPFRGHFIRYVLAYVGATWTEPNFPEMAAFKDRPVAEKPYPFIAPPVLHDQEKDIWVSQLPAIMMYLGRKHDLLSDPDQTLRLICDGSDILFEITRGHGAQMWDREAWEAFLPRLETWMQLHERLAVEFGTTAGQGYMFGADRPMLADLSLAALWHTMIDRLPTLRDLLHVQAPTVEGLVDRIALVPEVAALRAQWADSDPRYCAGQIERSLFEILE
ncbi:hypothetical protein [uncultured Shimia sp.]|uniref:hypothetical protein n=1 Tax=uncultured Shimia sp. TaxID=573152 RepID=UPI002633F2F7|nr:hypothetical protein [uncultured Shimia sp.]